MPSGSLPKTTTSNDYFNCYLSGPDVFVFICDFISSKPLVS